MDRTHPQSKVAGSLIKLEALGLTPGGTNFLSLCHFKGDWTIMAQIFFDQLFSLFELCRSPVHQSPHCCNAAPNQTISYTQQSLLYSMYVSGDIRKQSHVLKSDPFPFCGTSLGTGFLGGGGKMVRGSAFTPQDNVKCQGTSISIPATAIQLAHLRPLTCACRLRLYSVTTQQSVQLICHCGAPCFRITCSETSSMHCSSIVLFLHMYNEF